jgi:hypothetical protein
MCTLINIKFLASFTVNSPDNNCYPPIFSMFAETNDQNTIYSISFIDNADINSQQVH